jgi:hypothetical protein
MSDILNADAIRRHAEQSTDKRLTDSVEAITAIRADLEEVVALNTLLRRWSGDHLTKLQTRAEELHAILNDMLTDG